MRSKNLVFKDLQSRVLLSLAPTLFNVSLRVTEMFKFSIYLRVLFQFTLYSLFFSGEKSLSC